MVGDGPRSHSLPLHDLPWMTTAVSAATMKGWRSRMRSPGAVLLLLALGLVLAALVVVGPALKRRALWAVINACELADRVTGHAWPCLFVATTPEGRGIVVLQAPLEPGHILVVPTERIYGLESPEIDGPVGSDYLEASWRQRDVAARQVGAKGGWADFGMAINGPWHRTQKQLHVHVECLTPRAVASLAAKRAIPVDSWVPLEGFRRGTHVRRWPHSDLRGLDFRRVFFDDLPLPPDDDESHINVGAAGIVGPGGEREFLLLHSTRMSLERLLDADCEILRRPESGRPTESGTSRASP